MLEVLSWIIRLARYYEYAIVVYVLLSWVPGAQQSIIGKFLEKIVAPYLNLFKFIPPVAGVIDFSPIIAILVWNFAVSGLAHIILFLI